MRPPLPLTAALVATLLLAGCGVDAAPDAEPTTSSASPDASASESASPSEEPGQEPSGPSENLVEVTVDGDSISPSGKRVEASVGEPVVLQITSDRAGELHVHATPEQELAFAEGSTRVELTIDRPGVVEVEEHESGLVVLQLEVS